MFQYVSILIDAIVSRQSKLFKVHIIMSRECWYKIKTKAEYILTISEVEILKQKASTRRPWSEYTQKIYLVLEVQALVQD